MSNILDTRAQLRLLIPITIVRANLDNDPVLAIMILVVERWARNVEMPIQHLLILVIAAFSVEPTP
jgi:hypothetical protein